MKKASLLLSFIVSTFSLLAQGNEAYVLQTISAADYQDASFRLEGHLFIEDKARDAGALPIAVLSNGGKITKSIFDKYSMEEFKPNAWNRVSVAGKIEKADKISIGVVLSGKGKYYFDDFKLFIKKGNSEVEIPLNNSGFEQDSIAPWRVSNFKDKSGLKLTSDKFNSGRKSLFVDNSSATSEAYGSNDKVGKYADINGVKLYYEIYGSGEPLLL